MGILSAFAGCGAGPVESDGSSASEFLATEANFQNFHGWKSYLIPNGSALGGVHTAGPRTEYLSQSPPHGATEFPVGTIIVKETDDTDDLTKRTLFAMVKRGGGYNEAGATDWEFFGLSNRADGSVAVDWQGTNAPSGQSYSGPTSTPCNGCHNAVANDHVLSPNIILSNF